MSEENELFRQQLKDMMAEKDAERAAREPAEAAAKEGTDRRSEQVIQQPSVRGQQTPQQRYRSQTGTVLRFCHRTACVYESLMGERFTCGCLKNSNLFKW